MRDPGGVYVGFGWGRELLDRGIEHLAAIGPTRCGKDQSTVLKTMLDGWYGSTISHDPKGELWKTVAKRRSRFCHQLLFDPTDPRSVGLNVLDWIDKDEQTGLPNVGQIAAAVLLLTASAKPDHWLLASREYMVAGILHLMLAARDSEKNFGGLRRFVASGDRGLREMRDTVAHEVCARVAEQMLSVGKKSDDGSDEQAPSAYRGSVYNTTGALLALWDDPVVDKVTARSEFALADLMCAEDPVDLYLFNRPSHSERINPLLRCVLAMVRRAMMHDEKVTADGRVKNHRLLMVYNELLELKSGDEATATRAAASYGIRFLFAAQSLIDIERELGTGLLNNCAVRIFFRPNDDREAQRISAMIGETRVTIRHETKTYRQGGFLASGRSVSPREEPRPILPASELMQWEPRTNAIVLGYGKPILSEVRMAWQDRRWARMMAPPPEIRDADGNYLDLPGTFASPWLGRFVEIAERKPVKGPKKVRQDSAPSMAVFGIGAPDEVPPAAVESGNPGHGVAI